MQELNKPYNPKDHEEKIYKEWEKSGYFAPEAHQPRADNPDSDKTFCMVIPPPNITGSLHMGHALNATTQDILIRYHRMKGFKTLWLPGTDHAGIATQYVVEKELKKEGKTRFDLGREEFLKRVWEWREKYGFIILDQLKKLGASCDWSRTRFTLDPEYTKAVETAFLHYHKKGLIYQANRVVNWCSRCATSLSDLEVEYKEEEAELIFIKYPLDSARGKPLTNKSDYIVVATTRPETMLGDSAVAVNPKDERYKKLIGGRAVLPIKNLEIPIIADDSVDMEFGTGAVKVTPAHDVADFEIHERHNLPIYQVINEKGRMTEEAKFCVGLKTKECREKVVEELNKLGLIEKREKFIHNIAKCYRCDTVIEPLISKQWFLKMEDLAIKAKTEVENGNIKFHPENFTKTYLDWLSNIRDWSISRQLWWGHRLPVFCCKKQAGISNFQFLISKQNCVASATKPEKCPICGECEMIQSNDVLDTWFSSALWPFAALGWPSEALAKEAHHNSDLETFYPTQVLSTARDIINLWVSRMIFSGLEFTGKKPFSDVIIHATVLNKEGKRMSKSLGTGLDPLKLIEEFGADATRFALIWQAMGGQDIKWQQEAVMAGKKFLNKLWNASRFVMQKIGSTKSEILPLRQGFEGQVNPKQILNSKIQNKENKNIIEKFEETKKSTEELIKSYEFGPALHLLYEFFWHDFCNKYLEESKKMESSETSETLLYILAGTLKLLHPFTPFITEAIWGKINKENKKHLIVESW
ncbi:MAG: valine--tRNA ligase [bacterium]|nr:valine--tRNA ligase [bacterium]